MIEDKNIKEIIGLENSNKEYPFVGDTQECIIGMLLMDQVFLIQSIQLIKPFYFTKKSHQEVCAILFKYFDRYKHIPTKQVLFDLINERFDPVKSAIYQAELEYIFSTFVPGIETREFHLDQVTKFAKEMALKEAISKTFELLIQNSENKFEKIEEILKSAFIVNRNFDMGLDYFCTLDERYERMGKESERQEAFITGIDSIDNGLSSGGLCRGEIGSFMGLPGTGKSITLTKVAVRNILRSKKVLYISLEMDQDKIAKRFDAQFSLQSIKELYQNKNEVIPTIKSYVEEELDKRKLLIKQFPAGTADMGTIRAFVSQIELHGFKPDLICLDYVGEMKDRPDVKTYESRQKDVRDLRGFAVESNCCIYTAMQPSRGGREAQKDGVIDDNLLGDSYGQARPLDALWSINQNEAEKDCGVGRIFVAKHRDGKSRYTVYYRQSPDTLDINEIDKELYGNIMSQHMKKKSEDVELGKKVKGWKNNE